MTTDALGERFESGADKYAEYLKTPEGRLRLDLVFANLREILPTTGASKRALDIGGGTGAMAVRVAQLGFQVTLLDASEQMLDFARRSARDAAVEDMISLKHGDASELARLFEPESFELILCHNVLEFVDSPLAVLQDAAWALRAPSGIISVLVRNQPGEVMKAALLSGDLSAATRNLNTEWGDESLYGCRVRLFTAEGVKSLLQKSSFEVAAESGVRVVADYLPAKISRTDEYERVVELERKLGRRREFAAIARYTHCIARRKATAVKNRA